ncbi:hypothetical protein CDL12_29939 [Handroanthus impetiginosus]|uniref:KIB1-4 beta-propeller domain-containing protein n=1 Tax=Handroanthus impetiginosus TaxID=429701 RepID=A0A2G9FY41_9LAMI|nr:hypothetical protein CDL12_29939 [Handroanthus impetiginosus]
MASPFLMFPLADKKNREIHSLKLYSLKNKNSHTLNIVQNLEEEFQCCGSSRGWLAFSNENGIIFLLNPFSGAHIHLPFIEYKRIVKVFLPTSPSHDKNYVVVEMYEFECHTKLAFYDKCHDVVCCDESNMVFALVSGACVEAWDMNEDVLRKTVIIQDSYLKKLIIARHVFPPDRHSYQSYVALSLGSIFLSTRYIGESVNPKGEAELDLQGLINYPYKTVGFYVFRFDAERKNWIEVESLNEFALMDDEYSYGGHDMGIFNMEDGTIEPVMKRQKHRIQSPPFLICLPTPPQ